MKKSRGVLSEGGFQVFDDLGLRLVYDGSGNSYAIEELIGEEWVVVEQWKEPSPMPHLVNENMPSESY